MKPKGGEWPFKSIAETVAKVKAHYRDLLETADDEHEWAYAWRSEINNGGFRANDFLMQEIVDSGKCIGCASCVSICPTSVFDYSGTQASWVKMGTEGLQAGRTPWQRTTLYTELPAALTLA